MPHAARARKDAADDDDSGAGEQLSPPQQRFACACARDMPVLLARYDEPRVLHRRAIRYSAFLRYVHTHTQARRGDTNDMGDDVVLRGRCAAMCACDRVPDILDKALPLAVGDDALGHVDDKDDDNDDDVAMLAHDCETDDDNDDDDDASALRMLPSTTQGEAHTQVMQYLLQCDSATPSSPPLPSSSSCASPDDIRALYYGLREVPASSGEYVLLLHDAMQACEAAGKRVPECVYALTRAARVELTRDASSTPTPVDVIAHTGATGAAVVAAPSHDAAPTSLAAVRAMVARAVDAATRVAATTTSSRCSTTFCTSSSDGGNKDVSTTATTQLLLRGYAQHPLVYRSADTLLDALVPPRVFEYFDVSPQRVADEYARRTHRRCVVARLYREYVRQLHNNSNSNNSNSSSSSSAHVLRELREACAQLQCGSDPVVGHAWVLLARASRQWPSRAEMAALEAAVDAHLRRSHARGAGRPLRSSDFTAASNNNNNNNNNNNDNSSAMSTVAKTLSAPTTIVARHAAASTSSRLRAPPAAADNVATTATMAAVAAPHHATAVAAAANARAGSNNSSGGGTVSVMASLPLCELSAERSAVYYHLLAPELLRHVTLDLPERGVLLARVLHEGAYAMHVHNVLARASAQATSEQLVCGQDEREAAAQRVAALSRDVAALRQRRARAAERLRALREWSVQCRAAADETATRERRFRESLLQRLRHTAEEINARQERERHAAALADGE